MPNQDLLHNIIQKLLENNNCSLEAKPKKRFVELASSLFDGDLPCSRPKRTRIQPGSGSDQSRITNTTHRDNECKDARHIQHPQDEIKMIDQVFRSDEKNDCSKMTMIELAPYRLKQIRSVYLYGLHKVSKLQDLRHAPDAILPESNALDDQIFTQLSTRRTKADGAT